VVGRRTVVGGTSRQLGASPKLTSIIAPNALRRRAA
jgi:hypothetical protein